jgi:hypothetical protein
VSRDVVFERETRALLDRAHAACVLCVHHGDGPGPCRDCLENLLRDAVTVGAFLAVRAHTNAVERALFTCALRFPNLQASNSGLIRGFETSLAELRDYLAQISEHLAAVKDSGPSLGAGVGDA